MPLFQKNARKYRSFSVPVSFKMNESKDKLRDALNVFSIQDRLETRHGRSLYNTEALPGPVISMSYFETAKATKFLIAKVGGDVYAVSRTGAHTLLKSGLSETTKHRALTIARGESSRHIIAIENDGIFQFDGASFTTLGQGAPTPPTVAPLSGGTVADGSYRLAFTYYSSKTGFESNMSELSAVVGTSNQGIKVTNIPASASNAFIDKVRIYIKESTSVNPPTFVTEVNLATTEFDILTTPLSTDTPPIANAPPLNGGGRYMAEFNRCLVYAGNDVYLNDIYFSEPDLPDAFNDGTAPDRLVLYATLDGAITGLATGLYNNSVLDPFLVVFKKRSTHIYSEIGGEPKFVPISSEIGCVSHDTIKVKNGVVYFLSDQGFRCIINGQLAVDQLGNPITLGNGDIDDIFRSPGYAYEVNRSMLPGAFSVYYSTLDQYMTWLPEGGSNEFSKTYVYEYKIGGFKPYQFFTPSTAACTGHESTGEVVFMADSHGCIYVHSTFEERSDADHAGEIQDIEAFASMSWVDGDDLDCSLNFRELLLRRTAGTGDLLAKFNINFGFDDVGEVVFNNPQIGFVLDVSRTDIDKFGTNERLIITTRADINRVGENIMVSFYQKGNGLNIGLVAAQLEFSRNGNRN